MKKVRTGNDIHIMWTITKNNAVLIDDEGLDLTGAEVLLIDTFKKPATFTYSINQIEENKVQVVGTFYGKDQKTQGKYNLLLVKNRGEENMITLDYVDAFILTCVSKFGVIEGTDESTVTVATIELESDYNVYNGSPDMINYYTKEEIDQILEDYYTKQDIQSNYYDKSVIDSGLNAIAESIGNLYETKANRTDLSLHTENDNIHVTLEDKALWNTVASKANQSDLTAHTSNSDIHVTSTDKTNWNNKQSALSYYKENTASGIVPLYTLKGAIEDTDNKMISGIFDRGQGVLLNGNVYYDLPSMKTVMNGILTNDGDGEGVILQMVQDGNALSGISINKDDVDVITDGEFNYNGYEVATVNDVDSVETDLTTHTENTTIHVTQADKDNWNSKQDNLPFKRGTGTHSVTQATTTPLYNDNIIADGTNSFIWSRGCYGTANYQFNVGGVLGSMYITNVDSNYVNYTLRMVTTTPTFESIETFSSIYYYVGYLRNSFVNLKLYSSSTQKYLGKINSIVSFNEATPYEFVISIDKTGAEESLTTASNKTIVAATNVNNGSYSNLISQYSKMNGQYSSVLGCGNYLEGAFANLFGIGLTAVGKSNNVFGSHNLSLPFTGSVNARNNIFGTLNRINKTSGKNVFGFQNTISPYYGENSNTTYFDTIVGNNNTIATRGIFVGETMNSPIKNSDQLRFMFGGFLDDTTDGKRFKTIIGQYNEASNTNATWVLASGNDNNSRHNSLEVLHANNTYTTHIKDNVEIDGETHIKDDVEIDGAVTYADITKVEGATALVMNEPQHEVTDGIDIGGVTYYLDPNIIVKKGQIVIGDANYSGTYVALATVNNGEYTLISETLGEKLEVTYKATTDTVVLVYFNGVLIPEYVGIKIYDTVESLSAKSDKAVTSSTSNLKIEVVSTMPQTPDANTIYIVV